MANFPQGGSSGVTPGSYGSSTQVGQFTVNATGQITAAANVAIAFPITSFNGRAGAITLNSGDVTTALGFTPVNKAGDTMSGSLAVTGNISATGNLTGAGFAGTATTVTFGTSGASGTILFRPNGLGSGTGQVQIAADGSMSTPGNITATGNLTGAGFAGGSTTTAFGTSGSGGTVVLRPNGLGSGTGQAVIDQSGDLSITGTMSNQTSDVRVKTNFVEREPLPTHHLWWGDYDRTDTGAHGIGHKAQDVMAAAPHRVNTVAGILLPEGEPMLLLDRGGLAEEQGIWNGRQIDLIWKRLDEIAPRMQ
jgi:hypothetical protein